MNALAITIAPECDKIAWYQKADAELRIFKSAVGEMQIDSAIKSGRRLLSILETEQQFRAARRAKA